MSQNTQEIIGAVLPIVVALLLAFLAGGATVAGLLTLTLNNLLKSPVLITFLEKLYQGLSPEWQDVLRAGDKVIDEIVDDVPIGTKGSAAASAAADK